MSEQEFQISEQEFQEFQALVQHIEGTETNNFFELAKILGRDPLKDFVGADLSGTDLSGGKLSNADLHHVDLSNAFLSGADLSGADLSGADLSGADLSGADLSGADLSGADLSGSKINNATKLDFQWHLAWENAQKRISKISQAEKEIEPLIGKELIKRVKELGKLSKGQKAKACGYYTKTKNGVERVNMMRFLNALVDAEGIQLDSLPSTSKYGGRSANSRRISVNSNGNLLISSAYTKQMALQPGDEFEIILGQKHIYLKKLEREVGSNSNVKQLSQVK